MVSCLRRLEINIYHRNVNTIFFAMIEMFKNILGDLNKPFPSILQCWMDKSNDAAGLLRCASMINRFLNLARNDVANLIMLAGAFQ